MKKAIVCAVGSGGDVFPFFGVAAALQKRGYRVQLLIPGRYLAAARQAGLEASSVGADEVFEEVFGGADVWHPTKGTEASWRYWVAAGQTGYDKIREALANNVDEVVLVGSTFALGVRMAEETLGATATTVHLSPAIIFSAIEPPRWVAASIPHSWPLWLRRAAMSAAELLGVDPILKKKLNPLLVKNGLKPVSRVLSKWVHSPRRVVHAFPQWFASVQADWPANSAQTSFPIMSVRTNQALDAEIEVFLNRAGSRRVVVITAGTAVAQGASWVCEAIAATLSRKMLAIVVGLVSGRRVESPDVKYVAFAPFGLLLPRVHVLIHHGGVGTMAEAFRSGVAQIVVPSAHDQFDNAVRLVRLGAGVMADASWAAASFAGAIDGVLGSPAVAGAVSRCAQLMKSAGSAFEEIAEHAIAG